MFPATITTAKRFVSYHDWRTFIVSVIPASKRTSPTAMATYVLNTDESWWNNEASQSPEKYPARVSTAQTSA